METKLTQEQLKKLEDTLLELPAKYAIPLLQLINSFIAENNTPAPVESDAPQEAEEV